MSTVTRVIDIVNQIRGYPGVIPVLGTSPSTEIAVSIANDIIQKMLAQSLPWKFNRALINPFLSIALQQDYIGISKNNSTTAVTDLSWLEQCWAVDVNNTAIPKPVRGMESVRDLQQSWQQSIPFQISWIPVPLAIYGTWVANTSYPTGLGQTQTPTSPIQQFVDANGNFLYVSTNGTSGNVQPVLPASSAAGATVVDGTVTWTVADPNAVAMRLSPLPATSGIVWQLHPIYQMKAPIKTKLTDLITPIPDDYGYLFRQGFLAQCLVYSKDKEGRDAYNKWEEDLVIALRSGDRERSQETMYPSEGLMSGGPYQYGVPLGAAWPFGPSY